MRFIERDWLSSNQVLFFDDHEATLVDTGCTAHAPTTAQIVAHALGLARPNTRLSRILNTHLHSDHCGGNAALQRQHGAAVHVPIGSLEAVRQWDETALSYTGTGQHCEQFRADFALTPGDRFVAGAMQWQVHAAPGHDPLSLIFFAEQERILISADALWRHGFGVIFPELVDESGFAEQAAVIDHIEQLEPAIVLPGHGPMFTEVSEAIGEARSRLAALLEKPERNNRSAIRALVMFKLLEKRRTEVDELLSELQHADIIATAAAALEQTLQEGILSAIDDLIKGGQLVRDGQGIAVAG